MVLTAIKAAKEGKITREEVANLCKITKAKAYHLLNKMSNDEELELHGKGRGSFYAPKTHEIKKPNTHMRSCLFIREKRSKASFKFGFIFSMGLSLTCKQQNMEVQND